MFGEILKRLRKEKGLTQHELAETLAIGDSTLGMYETNKRFPDQETLIKISDFYNVSVDYLLGREDKHNPNSDMNYSDRIKYLMTKHNSNKQYTRNDIAKLLDTSPQYISNILANPDRRLSHDKHKTLAKFFRVPVEWIEGEIIENNLSQLDPEVKQLVNTIMKLTPKQRMILYEFLESIFE